MNDFHLYDLFNIITLIHHFKNKYRLLVTENSVSAVWYCAVPYIVSCVDVSEWYFRDRSCRQTFSMDTNSYFLAKLHFSVITLNT